MDDSEPSSEALDEFGVAGSPDKFDDPGVWERFSKPSRSLHLRQPISFPLELSARWSASSSISVLDNANVRFDCVTSNDVWSSDWASWSCFNMLV